MRSRLLAVLVPLLVAVAPALIPVTAAASPAPAATGPSPKLRVFAGQDDRWTVGGRWLIRRDPGDVGLAQHWERPGSADGWTPGTVPSVWNAGDDGNASMAGGVAWYRRELRLPRIASTRAGGRWILRFERVSVGATIWVGGRLIGRHRGAYEPFEVDVPARAIRRDGTLTLVVRSDSRRTPSDFPPGSTLADGSPGGGWWNDGGIPREVVLRHADQVDLRVQATPDLPCPTCAGTVRVRATLRNVTRHARTVDVVARIAGRATSLGRVRLKAGARGSVHATAKVPKPIVWSPKRPHLYRIDVDATLRGRRSGPLADRVGDRVAHWRARTGIRSIRVRAGRLELNFRPVNLRGVGLHEQDATHGSALTDRGQDLLLEQARELGGLVIRGHYPLHPRMLEEADRLGLLVWTEIPVYQVRASELKKRAVRLAALRLLRTTIETNAHHPSVFTWSVGNELTTNPGPSIVRYIKTARDVRDELDPTRPLSYARQAGVQRGCVGAYGRLDLIGLNDYFGWYGGPTDALADPVNLGPFLDKLRACNPNEAWMITETGAEANRDGPLEEHGTFAFQSAYAAYHFAVYRSRPWLSGAIWWGLREFRVRPNWAGGNPRPTPPWHGKGLLGRFGTRKPAWDVLHQEFGAVDQLAPAPTGPVTIPPSPPGGIAPPGPGEEGDAPTDPPVPAG